MKRKIAIVGLGYVGLPVAVSFGKKLEVIGFDINEKRIKDLNEGYDYTNEVTSCELQKVNIEFTSNKNSLKKSDFIIVSVPTPINRNNQPDLTPLINASKTVGSVLQKNTIIVFESTVYPGATEEICIPVLEEFSGLKCGKDFYVGYSPERINPGDKKNTFETITKVVSGQNPRVLDIVAEVYSLVVKAGVHRASSIKVAEAAKVIENTQRDVNIALMNELAIIFDKVGIDTRDVLEAASTKWNFMRFSPGLVGGHCIGVDPYYLTYKAEELGYYPEMILSGRRINDNMSEYIASSIIKEMIKKGFSMVNQSVNIFGLTFKENCSDLRNTKVMDLIRELQEFGFKVVVHDPEADPQEAREHYNVLLHSKDDLPNSDIIAFAVPHREYRENKKDYLKLLNNKGIVFDIKGMIEKNDLKENQSIWRL